MPSNFWRKRKMRITSYFLTTAAVSIIIAASPLSPAYAAADDFTDPTTKAPTTPPPANSETVKTLEENLPPTTPDWFRETYLQAQKSPLPKKVFDQGGVPAVIPQLEIDKDDTGETGSYQPKGQTVTSQNAFFQSLGENGRTCATCHQPASGMSVSVENIKKRLNKTKGTDPIFAAVDGSNCPSLVPDADTSGSLLGGHKGKGKKSFEEAHSLLINKGLFRIFLRVPLNAKYKISVVSDPTTCNLDSTYNQETDANGNKVQVVSVFRRPLMSGNLVWKTTTVFPAPNGKSGNIMWDGRELDLFTQARDATLGHAQATVEPTQKQLQEIVDFEMGMFNAQYSDKKAGVLSDLNATGGPKILADNAQKISFPPPGQPLPTTFDEFDRWATVSGNASAIEKRRSIFRGEQLFTGTALNDRGKFAIDNVSGFNGAFGIPNPAPGQTCATCHNFTHSGADFLPSAQRDIGIGGHHSLIRGPKPAKDLPLFKLECPAGSFMWDAALTTVFTNDPGKALITGECTDIGGITVPSLRALSARPPFFHDGSAKTLLDVVNVYDTRFGIGLTKTEKEDLVNFLSAL